MRAGFSGTPNISVPVHVTITVPRRKGVGLLASLFEPFVHRVGLPNHAARDVRSFASTMITNGSIRVRIRHGPLLPLVTAFTAQQFGDIRLPRGSKLD